MGKEIVYCSGCGVILRERDFLRGLARTVEFAHQCARCRPAASAAPASAALPRTDRVPLIPGRR